MNSYTPVTQQEQVGCVVRAGWYSSPPKPWFWSSHLKTLVN